MGNINRVEYMNSFTRGKDPKEALDIGLYHTSEEIENVRIIRLHRGHKKLHRTPRGNNVNYCESLSEIQVHNILGKMAENKYHRPDLLEITRISDEKDPFGGIMYYWTLGTALAGRRIKYRGRLYKIPEDLKNY